MSKPSAWLLALLAASLGAVLGSASDGGEPLGLPKGELSRSKRSPGGAELCPCPGTDRPPRHTRPRASCPCNPIGFFSMADEPHRRRRRRHHHHPHHHSGKARHHVQQRKRKECLQFLKHCLRRQISIPL